MHHPGMFTLETSRSGAGPMAALANLLLFGKEGLRTLLGHAVEMAEVLREDRIAPQPDGAQRRQRRPGDAVSRLPARRRHVHGQGPRTERPGLPGSIAHAQRVQPPHLRARARRGPGRPRRGDLADQLLPQTDYGKPIVALKSYVLSPFTDEDHMTSIIDHVLEARDAVQREWDA